MTDRVSKVEAAKLLGISRASLYLLLKEKRIAFYRPAHGGIQLRAADVLAYLESCRVEAVGPKPAAKGRRRMRLAPDRAQELERAKVIVMDRARRA